MVFLRFIYMDAIAFLTHEASRLFFFLFWFFTNVLTLNLLIANILDVVSTQIEKTKQDALDELARKEKEIREAEEAKFQ